MISTMKTTETLKLIDSTFSVNEGKEILLDLMSSKIKFHELRNFSSVERYGHPDEHSLQRIEELKAARRKIISFFNDFKLDNKRVIIHSNIHIEVE